MKAKVSSRLREVLPLISMLALRALKLREDSLDLSSGDSADAGSGSMPRSERFSDLTQVSMRRWCFLVRD